MKIRDNFLAIGPFFMFLGAFERHGHAAHYAFNFIKTYLFVEKLEPKTFWCSFFITRFWENMFFEKNIFGKFSKNVFKKCEHLEKIKKFIFFKVEKIVVFFEMFTFLKNVFWTFSEKIFRKNIFWKTSYEKTASKSVRL